MSKSKLNAEPSATRPSIREEDIRDETAAREPVRPTEVERVRRHKGITVNNKFHIPPELIPAGLSFEWKRNEVVGQPDYHYERSLGEQGWKPVDHSMLTGLFAAPGTTGPVKIDGMMLMERPLHLTQEAQREDYDRARSALQAGERSMAQAPAGTLERTAPVVRSSIEPMAVPD